MVTIGIPVYNEAKYLEETFESIIKNYSNIEKVIISDNASTDNTEEICRQYERKYDKFEYIKQEKSISVLENFYESLKRANTKYFMWLGGHDIISDNYIKKLVEILEANVDAVCAVSKVYLFDRNMLDNELYFDFLTPEYASDNVKERVNACFKDLRVCWCWYQLYKTSQLQIIASNLLKHKNWVNVDHILAIHTSLLGKILVDVDCTYYARELGRLHETEKKRVKRYESFFKTKIPMINPLKYIPEENWRLIQQYIPALKRNKMWREKVRRAYATQLNAYFYDSEWIVAEKDLKNNALAIDNALVKKYLGKRDKKYIVFGTGKYGESFYCFIKKYIKIDMFVDNSIKKQGGKLHGIHIMDPKVLCENVDKNVIIIGSLIYSDEIYKQLYNMGYRYGKNVFFYDEFLLKEKFKSEEGC